MQLNWKKEICNYRGKENVKRKVSLLLKVSLSSESIFCPRGCIKLNWTTDLFQKLTLVPKRSEFTIKPVLGSLFPSQ
jgi:hypothetical protein